MLWLCLENKTKGNKDKAEIDADTADKKNLRKDGLMIDVSLIYSNTIYLSKFPTPLSADTFSKLLV